jgi:AcrR family transcriptional regulator
MPVESTAHLAPPNKHQLKTEEMRRKLLRSARKIFTRDGFEAARIEDIAADAGHTRGAFYAHFSSKADLFFALLEQQATLYMERVRDLLADSENPEQRLRLLRDFYAGLIADRNWALLVLEFKLFAIRHPKMRGMQAKYAEAHRRVRMSVAMSAGPDGQETEMERPVKLALQGALAGMVVEQAFDPGVSKEEAAALLGRIFDCLVGERVE